jgi:hypothetical protein
VNWIKLKPLAGTQERLVRASFIVEVQIVSPSSIKLIDKRGNTYGWQGTVAEYSELAAALGISGDS